VDGHWAGPSFGEDSGRQAAQKPAGNKPAPAVL
jgi:hypothetical protein